MGYGSLTMTNFSKLFTLAQCKCVWKRSLLERVWSSQITLRLGSLQHFRVKNIILNKCCWNLFGHFFLCVFDESLKIAEYKIWYWCKEESLPCKYHRTGGPIEMCSVLCSNRTWVILRAAHVMRGCLTYKFPFSSTCSDQLSGKGAESPSTAIHMSALSTSGSSPRYCNTAYG